MQISYFFLQDFEAQARFLFHGSTHNRWFDKCVNFVVGSSGAVGANVEHSALDATVTRGGVFGAQPISIHIRMFARSSLCVGVCMYCYF